MSDYNSSDVILKLNGNDFAWYLIERKNQKQNLLVQHLLSNAFSAYIEGPKFKATRDKLNATIEVANFLPVLSPQECMWILCPVHMEMHFDSCWQ